MAFYCHLKLEAFFALFGVLSGDGILILPLCSFDSGPPLRGSRTHSAPTYRHKVAVVASTLHRIRSLSSPSH